MLNIRSVHKGGPMSETPFLIKKNWISHGRECSRNKVMKIENDRGTILDPYAKNEVCKKRVPCLKIFFDL